MTTLFRSDPAPARTTLLRAWRAWRAGGGDQWRMLADMRLLLLHAQTSPRLYVFGSRTVRPPVGPGPTSSSASSASCRHSTRSAGMRRWAAGDKAICWSGARRRCRAASASGWRLWALPRSRSCCAMDEPLAALDERHKQEILPYLERLHDEFGVRYCGQPFPDEGGPAGRSSVLLGRGRVLASGRSPAPGCEPASCARR